jgi:hypothetical protein
MVTTTSIWTRAEQPLFNAWEATTPFGEFFLHEPRYEKWYRDLWAQDEALRHYKILLAALEVHEQFPAPPRCLTRNASIAFSPSPAIRDQPPPTYRELRAAAREVRRRPRAYTI